MGSAGYRRHSLSHGTSSICKRFGLAAQCLYGTGCTRPFPFAAGQGTTGEDGLAAVTAAGSRPGRTGGKGGPAFKVEQGRPMALAPSLLLASGERQTGGEVQAKAHLKDSSPPGAPFPPLFGGLMFRGGHGCPFPGLLHMCTCMTWLGKGKSPGISMCPLGKPH